MESIYNNYQLALYIYSFAYFLEIMLFENFEKSYLESVSRTIQKHCEDYGILYQKTYEMIKEYSITSMENYSVKVLSEISKGTGKVISKIPLINQTLLDENLIASGEQLKQTSENRTRRTMETIFSGDTDFIAPFIENINTVNLLNNEPVDILIDEDTLYIKSK